MIHVDTKSNSLFSIFWLLLLCVLALVLTLHACEDEQTLVPAHATTEVRK